MTSAARDFYTTGWADLLPYDATRLNTTIDAATRSDLDGTLDQIYAHLTRDGSTILDRPLNWLIHSGADINTADLRRQHTFDTAVTAAGHTPARTFRDLHHLLAALGVLSRTDAGVERWRMPDMLPLPEEVLPLPAEQVAAMAEDRWQALHADTVAAIIAYFRESLNEPDLTVTSIRQLAGWTGQELESVRNALPVLCGGGMRMLDGGLCDANPLTTGDDATFTLVCDWALLYERHLVLVDDDEDA